VTAAQRQTIRDAIDQRKRQALGNIDCDNPSESSYTYWGCRCHACVTAQYEANKKRRHRRPGSVTVHNYCGYANGCRCDVCRADHGRYQRERAQLRRERDSTKVLAA
jgi:hypothetical protein